MRNKKAAIRFAERFAECTPPRDGDNAYVAAMTTLRNYVASNASYGVKIEVCRASPCQPFGLLLTKEVSYQLSNGVLLTDAEVSEPLDLSADSEDLGKSIMDQVAAFDSMLANLEHESTRNRLRLEGGP